MRNDHFIRRAQWATRRDAEPGFLPRAFHFTMQAIGLAAFFAIAAMVLCFFG